MSEKRALERVTDLEKLLQKVLNQLILNMSDECVDLENPKTKFEKQFLPLAKEIQDAL